MIDYAKTHKNTTPGRLLACRPGERGFEGKAMLNDYGLIAQNVRGISSYSTEGDGAGGEICKLGILFFSPKVDHNVTVEVELSKGSAFSDWQIRRLLNLQAFSPARRRLQSRDA